MRQHRHLSKLALVFGLVLLSAGCATKPRIALHHAEIRSASLFGIGLSVVMSVDNPNSFDLEVRNVRVTVTFADRYSLPEIMYSPNQWLPAGKTTLVRVPVTIPFAMVPNLVSATASAPSLKYHVSGSVDLTATSSLEVEKDNYPIDEDGSIQQAELLGAAGVKL
jgi:LEA14-like dessication related protein